MTTGMIRSNLVDKKLIGLQDLRERGLDYLRSLVQDAIKAHWDVDGAFNAKLGLTSFAVDKVQVTGTSLSTDGMGHVLKVGNIWASDAKFQNALGVTYYVGMRYTEIPVGVSINPRTGKVQYQSWQEQIGYSGSPQSSGVTDNGNGTITFNVNTVTESGVSNAGRFVMVYKNVPADGALTEAIAIELCTVVWNGTDNVITTVGSLGQDNISQVSDDYTVVLLGLTVSRNINLQADPITMFLGTVVGVGAGSQPSVFDTTNQRLLKTFDDASQILFTAYKWLTAGTVQEAFQQVVDILDSTSVPGTSKIGTTLTAFGVKAAMGTLPQAGIGTVADGTFTTSSRLDAVLAAIDAAIRRKQSWTATFSDGGAFTSDYSHTALASQWTDAMFWLRKQGTPATNKFTLLGGPGDSGARQAYVVGEISDPGIEPANKTVITTSGGTTAAAIYRGTFHRVYFSPNHGGVVQFGDPSNGHNVICEDWGARSGYVTITDFHTIAPQPFHLRNGVIKPVSNSDNAPNGAALSITHDAAGQNWAHGIIENMVITGPTGSQTSPIAALYASLNLTTGLNSSVMRPLTFRNCVFIQGGADVPIVKLDGIFKYTFENCSFIGRGRSASVLFQAINGAHVILRNCYFHAPEGSALSIQACSGLVDGCIFNADGTTTSSNANPKIIEAWGATNAPLVLKNNTVFVGIGASRPTGTATSPLVKIGNNSTAALTQCDGMHILYTTGFNQNIHRSATLHIQGNGPHGAKTVASNIRVDFGGFTRAADNVNVNGYTALVYCDNCRVNGLTMINLGAPGAVVNTVLLAVYQSTVSDVYLDCGGNGDNTHKWGSCIQIESRSEVRNVELLGVAINTTNGVIYMGGSNGGWSKLSHVHSENLYANSPAMIHITADESYVDNVHIMGYVKTFAPALFVDRANRCVVTNIKVRDDQFSTGFPLVQVSGGASTTQGRQNLLSNIWCEYNGTSDLAVRHYGYDGIAANIIGRRTSGATQVAGVLGGSNTTLSNVVLSTV